MATSLRLHVVLEPTLESVFCETGLDELVSQNDVDATDRRRVNSLVLLSSLLGLVAADQGLINVMRLRDDLEKREAKNKVVCFDSH